MEGTDKPGTREHRLLSQTACACETNTLRSQITHACETGDSPKQSNSACHFKTLRVQTVFLHEREPASQNSCCLGLSSMSPCHGSAQCSISKLKTTNRVAEIAVVGESPSIAHRGQTNQGGVKTQPHDLAQGASALSSFVLLPQPRARTHSTNLVA